MSISYLKKLIQEAIEEDNRNRSSRRRTRTPHERKLRESLRKAKILIEEADPGKVDDERFPLELSAAAAKAGEAEQLVTGGDDDGVQPEDVVQAKQGSMAVKELKPSQSSMNIEKAVAFAIAAILQKEPFGGGPGGDLGAIITSDNHIMDGHHRWIASGMVDPTSEVGGYIVKFPAKQMIAALNMITVKLGITKGKPGSGGFDQFNEAGILPVLQKYAAEGVWSADDDAARVMEALEKFSGKTGDEAIAESAKLMGSNVSQLTLEVPAGFPARPDMPVISKKAGHLDQAIELLRSGQVDLNEPYAEEAAPDENASKEDAPEKEVATESNFKKGDIILERWNKLAGI